MRSDPNVIAPPPYDQPLPVASPIEARPTPRWMAPARAVNPEIATLLPPVGIIRMGAQAPPAIPRSASAATVAETAAARPIAKGTSLVTTIAVIGTAMGVGGLAMIPILDREDKTSSHAAIADVAPRERSASSGVVLGKSVLGKVEPRPSEPSAPARISRPEPARGTSPLPVTVEPSEGAFNSGIAEIEELLRQRNTSSATDAMRRLATGVLSEPQATRITQYAALVAAAHGFWEGFENALGTAAAGRLLMWDGQEAVLVEVRETHLVVRRAGQNHRLVRRDLSDELVGALAEGLLDLDDPRNQVQMGAFLYSAREGDRDRARRLWESAAASGEDVSLLMPLVANP